MLPTAPPLPNSSGEGAPRSRSKLLPVVDSLAPPGPTPGPVTLPSNPSRATIRPLLVSSRLGSERGPSRTSKEDELLLLMQVLLLVAFGFIIVPGPGEVSSAIVPHAPCSLCSFGVVNRVSG